MSKGFMMKDIGLDVVRNGYEPVPVTPGYKAPLIEGWSRIDVDEDVVSKWAANGRARNYIGLRTGHTAGIDIDIDNQELTETLREDVYWSLLGGPAPTRYGRVGRCLIMCACSDLGKKKTLKLIDPEGNKHAIEILQKGQQFVAYGIHPDTRKQYEWENGDPLSVSHDELPVVSDSELSLWLESVPLLLPSGWAVEESNTMDEDELFLVQYRPPRAVEEMDLEERVNHEAMVNFSAWVPSLFPDAREYDGGYRVSSKDLGRDLEEDLAFHPNGVYDFGEETGMMPLQTVEKWCTNGDKEKAVAKLSSLLGLDPDAIAEQYRKANAPRSEIWKDRIQAAATKEQLETKIARGISKELELTAIQRDMLVEVFRKKYNELTGSKPAKTVVAKDLKPTRSVKADGETETPSWLTDWFYVTRFDKFFRYNSSEWLTAQGFNACFRRFMPVEPDSGKRADACMFALNDCEIPTVTSAVYAPHLGREFDMDGEKCVNLFMPSSVPPADDALQGEGLEAVETLKRHIMNICGQRKDVYEVFMSWMAYNVQNPGKKIRFAPLIRGVEGDGKSLTSAAMAGALGSRNVRTTAPQVVTSQFNGFAEGAQVVAIEEIRLVGHNRYDVLNALKPLLTNDTVSIHRKGVDEYNIMNVTNYIAYTNYADALPLDDPDRRWFVIFTPWESVSAMRREIGAESLTEYFNQVHDAINHHSPAIRRWLLDYKISELFNPNGHAPMTEEKQSMIARSSSDDEEALRQIIEKGGEGVNMAAISTSHLTTLLDLSDEIDEPIKSLALAKMLEKCGFFRYSKPVKWKQKTCRVWVKRLHGATPESIRKLLDGEEAPF